MEVTFLLVKMLSKEFKADFLPSKHTRETKNYAAASPDSG